MSRRALVPTPELRKKVHVFAGVGTPHDDIAKVVGCTAKTLRKHFRDELDGAAIETNARVAGFLFASAKEGNVAAQKFWLEHRAGWGKKPTPEAAVENPRVPKGPPPVTAVWGTGGDAKF